MDYSTLNLKAKNSYEESINTLNGLISNLSYISKSVAKGPEIRLQHIPNTQMFCERAGVHMSDINKLKTIHIAGTKGKGSTCIYIESILRKYGYKTGLFTSPHLKEVRERIKINGTPISMDEFSDYFWPVYDRLLSTKRHSHDMPFYFQFLTILAFDVFVKEKVDFIILETGIGGRFDTTNIISKPIIACITAIGYDHMEILGNTLSEISWNKAGIIKQESIVLTCDNQAIEALNVIENEVKATNSKLYLVPTTGNKIINVINKHTSIHCENAFLASAVCQMILNKNFALNLDNSSALNNVFKIPADSCLPEDHKQVIRSTYVHGRYQIIKKAQIEYYIDGAHTVESIQTSVEWFKEVVEDQKFEKRYLIFMITGNRSIENLLSRLLVLNFDGILLSPLVPFTNNRIIDFATDNNNIDRDKSKLAEIGATWTRLNLLNDNDKVAVEYFQSFEDIDQWLVQSKKCTQVLIVGSLHLVGCALVVLT